MSAAPELKPGPIFYRAAERPYRREPHEPGVRLLRVFARDPSLQQNEGAITTLPVPFEPLPAATPVAVPGLSIKPRDDPEGVPELCVLRGCLFSVWLPVSTLATAERERLREQPDAGLNQPMVAMHYGHPPSTTDALFKAQMVYAVANVVYDRFRRALGRNPDWGFRPNGSGACWHDQTLRLRPLALPDTANAYYDPLCGEVCFGSFGAADTTPGRAQPGSRVHTALSHDVVVHEVVHALLDGLKPLLLVPSNEDVLAFHEGFADLIALFLHFSHRDIVEQAIRRSQGALSDGLLVDLARQFGQAVAGTSSALRTGLTNAADPTAPIPSEHSYQRWLEPHALGSVLVSAVFEAFRVVYQRKTARLRHLGQRGGDIGAELASLLAAQAGKLAEQFLNIVIRAIDYLPPVDPTFGEYLRALLTADRDMVAEDRWGYREALVYAFRRYGICVPGVPDLSEESLLWKAPDFELAAKPLVRLIGFSPDTVAPKTASERLEEASELWKELATHADALGLDAAPPASVDDNTRQRLDPVQLQGIRPLRRVGPDGDIVYDVLVELSQHERIEGLSYYRGCTLIFDAKGRLRYTIGKGAGLDHGQTRGRRHRYRDFVAGIGTRYVAHLCAEDKTACASSLLLQVHQRLGHLGWLQPGDHDGGGR